MNDSNVVLGSFSRPQTCKEEKEEAEEEERAKTKNEVGAKKKGGKQKKKIDTVVTRKNEIFCIIPKDGVVTWSLSYLKKQKQKKVTMNIRTYVYRRLVKSTFRFAICRRSFSRSACTIHQQIIHTVIYIYIYVYNIVLYYIIYVYIFKIISKRRENFDWTQLLSSFYFFE